MSTPQTLRENDFRALKRKERLEDIATEGRRFVKLFERAYSGKASPREAVKALCLECIGFDIEAIRNCTAPACAVFELRPFQEKRGRQ